MTPDDIEQSVSHVRRHIDGVLERHMKEEDRRFKDLQQEINLLKTKLYP